MKKKLTWLYKQEVKPDFDYFFLVGVAFIFTLLRIPSLIEPDWYGDEGIYQVIGVALRHGRLLYRDIWDNKPPVLYLYYALISGDLFYIRLFSLVFGVGAVIAFFFLARTLFDRKRLPVFLSTGVFAVLFGLPLLEGNIANAENFMLFPTLISLSLMLKLKAKSNILLPVFAGLFLSLSFLTKIVAVFDLGAFLVILFTLRFLNQPFNSIKNHLFSSKKKFVQALKHEIILFISFCVPILLTVLFFFFHGALGDFIKAAFSQNVGYVGYGNYFLIPQGFLILKLMLLVLAVILIFIFRKKCGASGVVVYAWVAFSVFSAFFSGRPYTHYVLVALPAVCLLVGLTFYRKKAFLFNLFMVLFVAILFKLNFNLYTKIIPYYKNYADFVMDGKSVPAYQAFFDQNTPKNYEIARFISMNTKNSEGIFLLSDSSTIYYLADKLPPGRYIVKYHISFYKNGVEETKRAIDVVRPKYIIGVQDSLLSNFTQGYALKYTLQGLNMYERQL